MYGWSDTDCVYEFVGVSHEIPTDPYAYFQCKDCREVIKVRRSNFALVFPDNDMTLILEELDAKKAN